MKRVFPKNFFFHRGLRNCLLLLGFFSISGNQAIAQLDTEFWFAPPELTEALNPGTDGPRDRPIQLVISTLEKAARVEILKPADASFSPIIENIPANSTRIVNLTSFIDGLESKPENTVLTTGLLIRSTQSISAYYEIKSQNNTDLFALKGLNAKGRKFYVPFQTHWNNSLRKGPNGGFYNPETYASFDIVATDDSTEVTVTPSKDLVGHPAGVPFTFMLNRGQVYSCRAIDRFGANHPAGSRIESTKDVAVTMKDDMLQFDTSEQVPGADIAGDQLIPYEFLGDNYALVKGGLNGNNDRCYILATEDNTIVRINGIADPVDTLNEGEQFELIMTQPSYFVSTNGKKVAVLHISGLSDQLAGAMIPALTCTGTNRIGFTRTTSNTFIINVITKLSSIGKFTLNGDPTLVPASAFTAIQGGNGWAFAKITLSTADVPAGTTLLLKNSGNELFHLGVMNYAAGVGSNYGYFSNFSKLNLGRVKNVCTGDTALLDAGPAKTSYLWSTGDTSRTIETLIPGKYWVTTLSGSDCPKSDTVTVRFYTPDFELGPNDTICTGASKLLTPDGVFTYQWQDGSTATSYLVTQAGIYWAQVADFQGCQTRDSIEILESPRPVTPVVTGGDTVCKGNTVALSMNVISNAFYAWLDPGNNVISGRHINVNTGTQPTGFYKGFIKVNGCESLSDSAMVAVTDPPPANLGADTILCFTSGTLVLDPLSHQPGFQYLWSDGSTDSSLAVTASGMYSVRVTNAEGCSAFDTIQVTFQGPAGAVTLTGPDQFCENHPATFGVVQVPGTVYNWTGPDGFVFTGNQVSISSIQASQAGIYSVTPFLNGCSGTPAGKEVSVQRFPVVNLGPDTAACGFFSKLLDPVTGSAGLFFSWNDGSTDSVLVATTQGTYIVEVSNAACIASDTIQIEFGVGPDTVVFQGQRVYCEGENASFGVVPVQGESYSWSGPDGFVFNGSQVSLPAVGLASAGIYTVTPSLPGCPGRPFSISLQVNLRPAFPGMKDTSICAGGNIILDPVPNGNGEVFYLWNTGSADSTLTVSVPGTYSVILDNGLCQSFDTVQVGTRPAPAAPLVTGDTAICPGSSVTFGVQPVQGLSYSWSGPGGFSASGSTVSLQNVAENNFGTYFVTASLNNCLSDTARLQLSRQPAPQLSLPDTASICDGQPVTLDPGNFGSGATYLWSNGSSDSSIVVSQPGLVSVVVSNGTCSSEGQTIVRNASTPSPLLISGNTSICSGTELVLNVQNGPGAQVTWTGPNGFSAQGNGISISNIQTSGSGLYIASQTASGCPGTGDTASVVVIESPLTSLPPSITLCDGLSADLDPVQAGAGYTYLWSTGSTDSVISVSNAGLVTVSVSNQFCSVTDSVLVSISLAPSAITISGPDQACAGADIQLSVNAQPGVSLLWSGPAGFTSSSAQVNLSGLQAVNAGTYSVEQNLNGCPGPGASITISVLPSPQPILGDQVSACAGDQILLDPALNGPEYSYLWSNGSTDSSLVVNQSGNYSVLVSLGSCSAIDSIEVIISQPLAAVQISGPAEACQGTDLVLAASPSAEGVLYTWTGPAGATAQGTEFSLANVQVLQSGDYILNQSQNGCQGTGDTLSLTINPVPEIDLVSSISVCDGNPVLLDPVTSSEGLTFSWSTGSSDTSIVVSLPGAYSVSVSNGLCSSIDSVIVQVGQTPPPLSITGPSQACSGSSVSFNANVANGVSVVWTGPNGFSSFNSLITLSNLQAAQAGNYIVSQTLNGCEGQGDTISLNIVPVPLVELGPALSVCSGTPVLLDPVSGSQGLTFLWSNGSTDSSISVSQGGTFSVQVSNSVCTIEDSVQINVGETPQPVFISGSNAYCSGTDALLSSNAASGVSVLWTGPNGFTSTDASIVLPGIQPAQSGLYVLSQSLDGCPGQGDSVLVSVTQSPVADLGEDVSVCDGSPLLLDPVSSGAGFSYQWNTGSTDSSLTVGQSGLYLVTVSNGDCQAVDSVNVLFGTTPPPISISGQSVVCQGQDLVLNTDALAEVQVDWTGPGSFSFTGSTLVLSNIQLNQAGQYIAVPYDNGCPGQADTIQLAVNPGPQIELGPNLAVCNGSQVVLDPVQGSQGLTFQWSTGSTDSSIVVTQAGVYSVVVSDGGICPATDSINVIDGVAPPSVAVSGDTLYCAGSTAVFGVPALNQISYSWTGPNGFTSVADTIVIPNVSQANAGVYSVTASLGNCPGQPVSVNLVIGPDLVVDLGSDDTICGTGPVVLNPMNSAPGYSYQWNVGSTDSVILAFQTGIYAVTVRNQGCAKTDSVRLTFDTPPGTPTIVGSSTYCVGTNAQLGLQGTEPGVVYTWTGPNGLIQTGETLSLTGLNLASSGDYQVTPVRGSCSGTPVQITISVFQVPQVNLGNDIQSCEGNSVTLNAGSSVSGISYLWSNGSTDSTISVNASGVYSVELSNGSSCVGRDTIEVQFFDQPGAPLISGDFNYCEGENATFSANMPAGISVAWTGPNGFSSQGSQVSIPSIGAGQAGYYKALPFTPGCLGTADSVLISVSPNPSLELGPDTTTCSGVPVVVGVNAQPGITYQWTGGSNSSTISVSGSGMFYLTATNAGQCSATDSIGLTIKPSPQPVQVISGSQTICAYERTTFRILGKENEQYSWSGPGGFAAAGDSVSVGSGISSAGTYQVTAVLDGCSGSPVSMELVLKTVPTLAVSYDSLVCKGKFRIATAAASDGADVFWSNLSSDASTQLSVGRHWVMASLNGCSVSDTFTVKNAGPSVAFSTSPSDSLLEVYKDVSFIDQTLAGISPLASWHWDLGYSTQSSERNPVKRYNFESPVEVSLIVTDQAGCSDTLVKTLQIGAPKGWFIPNLFTPNGDNLNDKFEIRDLDKFPGTSLRVVSRWGKVAADIADYKNDWTGEGLEEGMYFYHIHRSDGQAFSGLIELNR